MAKKLYDHPPGIRNKLCGSHLVPLEQFSDDGKNWKSQSDLERILMYCHANANPVVILSKGPSTSSLIDTKIAKSWIFVKSSSSKTDSILSEVSSIAINLDAKL